MICASSLDTHSSTVFPSSSVTFKDAPGSSFLSVEVCFGKFYRSLFIFKGERILCNTGSTALVLKSEFLRFLVCHIAIRGGKFLNVVPAINREICSKLDLSLLICGLQFDQGVFRKEYFSF